MDEPAGGDDLCGMFDRVKVADEIIVLILDFFFVTVFAVFIQYI